MIPMRGAGRDYQMILDPVAETSPDPDCGHCCGDGVPQSLQHQFLADESSNMACPHCWPEARVIVVPDAAPAAVPTPVGDA